jgi:DNA-binding CsgD family transcriptional regulator
MTAVDSFAGPRVELARYRVAVRSRLCSRRASLVSRHTSPEHVLDRLVAGLTIRAIALDLDLGEETVRGYLLGAYRKLGVRTRGEAIAAHLARRSQEPARRLPRSSSRSSPSRRFRSAPTGRVAP